MIGRVIADYKITAYLGRGAMGDVYQAEHTRMHGLIVAIKFIPEEYLGDAKAKARFLREAETLATTNHRNVYRFYQFGDTPEGRSYIIVSYCDGGTLAEFIARGKCSVSDALKIAIGIAEGLDHAHTQGVIHRDIKPRNLMFHRGDVQLVDFSLALLAERSHLTGSEATVGTLLYTSPEQAQGEPVDGRTDIFAFGSVLYELLTGKAPFYSEHAASVLFKIVNQPHPPIRGLRPDLPESFAHVVDQCLAKKPSDRYESAAALVADLKAVQAELDPDKRTTSTWWIRRRRRLALRISLAALAVMVVTGVWQRCWLIRTLGLGYCAGEPGIVVLPVQPAGGTDDERAFVAGLTRDLTNRIRAHRAANPAAWTVAPDRTTFAAVKDPENARGRLGVRLAITATAASHGGSQTIDLQSFDVRSSAEPRDKRVIDMAGHFDSNAIGASLRDLAGLKPVAAADSGYTRDPNAYRAYLTGLGYLEAGRTSIDPAATALESALSIDSTFTRARAALGETYQRRYEATGDTTWANLAGRTCRAALASLSSQTDPHLTLARVYAAREETDRAVKSLEQALAVDPRCREALWQLAGIRTAEGRKREAESAYIRAVDTNRGDPTTYEMLGWIYLAQERYEDAIAPFQRVSRLIPVYGQTYNYLGACCFGLGCWDEATVMFTRSFELARAFTPCANLGTLYYMKNDYATAAQMYTWAREYWPDNYDVVCTLGDCYYWIPGKQEEAIKLYEEAAELARTARAARPTDAHLPALLAGIYSILAPDSVPAMVEQALALGPDVADVHYRVATAYEIIGAREKALKHLATAIDLGQSVRQIATEPFLATLRTDTRYEVLRSQRKETERQCPKVQ